MASAWPGVHSSGTVTSIFMTACPPGRCSAEGSRSGALPANATILPATITVKAPEARGAGRVHVPQPPSRTGGSRLRGDQPASSASSGRIRAVGLPVAEVHIRGLVADAADAAYLAPLEVPAKRLGSSASSGPRSSLAPRQGDLQRPAAGEPPDSRWGLSSEGDDGGEQAGCGRAASEGAAEFDGVQ